MDEMGCSAEIVADEWCNTLEDIIDFSKEKAGHMAQIKTPDLGGINNAIEAVLYCQQHGMGAYLGGTCNETNRSAEICAHIAMATSPDQMLAKPGMGVDEGYMLVYNEMSRIIALKDIRVLSPTAILGYGFPLESFQEGMKRKPDVIAVDAGSTDPGPYYLGAGISFTDRNSVKRDLEIMIPAAIEAGIPVIIGSSGGSGGRPHVEINRKIIEEIAQAKGLTFKYAEISAEFDKELVRKYFKDGKITPLSPAPELKEQDIDDAVRIVAQMGEEPFIEALNNGAQVILAGRAYDPTVFSALAISKGYPKGLAIHMGKILECAAICALPGSGSDCMFGYLRKDHFFLQTVSVLPYLLLLILFMRSQILICYLVLVDVLTFTIPLSNRYLIIEYV